MLFRCTIKESWKAFSCGSLVHFESALQLSEKDEKQLQPPLPPFIKCTALGTDDIHMSQVGQGLPVDPLICLTPDRCVSEQNLLTRLHLMNVFVYSERYTKRTKPATFCLPRWKRASGEWQVRTMHVCSKFHSDGVRAIKIFHQMQKLWLWHRLRRRILCGLSVSVQHFMAIHQSNKWDILTLNQVLHQPGIKFCTHWTWHHTGQL